jgi:hypothetical protein
MYSLLCARYHNLCSWFMSRRAWYLNPVFLLCWLVQSSSNSRLLLRHPFFPSLAHFTSRLNQKRKFWDGYLRNIWLGLYFQNLCASVYFHGCFNIFWMSFLMSSYLCIPRLLRCFRRVLFPGFYLGMQDLFLDRC